MTAPSAPVAARLRAALRFDGIWWRKLAWLGCVYGPEWWKQGSPPLIAALIYAGVGRNRRGAVTNLQRVLGDPDPRRARQMALRMYAEFARCMTETLEHFGPRPQPVRIDEPTRDVVGEALAEGRGLVLVTGHVGNWDVAARTLEQYDRPFNLVMAHERNATTSAYARAIRERAGMRVIYSDTSVFSSLNMIRALRDNEIVAIQLDRTLGVGTTRMVEFFGAPAPFPTGPFVLARLAGAPLLPVFFPRLGTRHYAIRLGTRLTLPRDAGDAPALARAMRAVAAELEDVIREFPHQWFQFAPFWPEDAAPSARQRPADRDARVRGRRD
ncbi:lysophospholipid acyltransferase family protein [bacterium]|nr:lysophospholipid acyltransferase family protein [bacterium]